MVLLQLGLQGLTSLSGTALTGVKTAIIIALLIYFAPAVELALIIIGFEVLLRFDLGGSINALSKILLNKNFSLIPTNLNQNAIASDIYKLNSFTNILLNSNRAILYGGFFLVIISLTAGVINPTLVTTMGIFFNFANYFVQLEIVVFSILLALVVIDNFTDILIQVSKLVR